MATVREIYDYFNALLPKSLSCEWDNDGVMLCKNGEKTVKKILCVLDVTDKVIEYAKENRCELIISHHPFIFGKIKSLYDSKISQSIFSLIDSEISVFSFHTRLDAQIGGINDILAKKLSLIEATPFGNEEGEMGRSGFLPEKMPLFDFAKKVKEILGAPYVNVGENSPFAHKIAVLGGSGKDFVASAASVADTFVTGECSYHTMLCAKEYGVNIIEAGHFYTEKCAREFFVEKIGEKFPEIIALAPDFECEVKTV